MVGRKDILDWLDFKVAKAAGLEKIAHNGTFNANPLSAAAGIATLEIVGSTDACARANAFGDAVRARMNEVLAEEGVAWAVHGTYSSLHIYTNPEGADIVPGRFDAAAFIPRMLNKRGVDISGPVRMGLLVNGVDVNSALSGWISATHGEEELAATADALRTTVRALRREGVIE
ncbi:hypothetical protein CCS01_23815 [Rhodopila globiformis]|uniref:Glutamate-1-semialdehyde 2,1-aminomutase n=1 Tax=Rhodopila globiformis TaxID=1071 RepID=A0A2S6N289_RHOGL|nr:hypothetical protein CCS01_23815 [Rhodopila globiformis]